MVVQEKWELAGGPPGVAWTSPTMPDWRLAGSREPQALQRPLAPLGAPQHACCPVGVSAVHPGPPNPSLQGQVVGVGGAQEEEPIPGTQLRRGGKDRWGRKDPLSSSLQREPGDLGGGAHSMLTPQLCAGLGEKGNARWRRSTLTHLALKDRDKGKLGSWRMGRGVGISEGSP